MKNTITYNLRDESGTSDDYYEKIADYSDLVLDFIERNYGWIITLYHSFILNDTKEKERSRGEYCVELLTLGMMWRKYAGASQASSKPIIKFLSFLYSKRSDNEKQKNRIDSLRGIITGIFVAPNIGVAPRDHEYNLINFKKLLTWLEATGEFKEEVKRLNNWIAFCGNLNRWKTNFILSSSVALFDWFSISSQLELGGFTKHLPRFLEEHKRNYRFREDRIFTGKNEIEYHLNMIGAEIMNRGFREKFEKQKNHVLLAPGCMRIDPDNCKSITKGKDIVCSRCNPNCNVAQLTDFSKLNGIIVYIIPHSSGFSESLQRWKEDTDTGLIAAACLLNLVPGGYEMRDLDLKAQCILLDYCGCKKHWHEKGIPTNLNHDRVSKFINNQN